MINQDIVAGIDIGGTNTAYGLIDHTGKTLYSSSIKTNSDEGAISFFKRLADEINKALSLIPEKTILTGIGIGAPNANYYTSTIENPPNLNWGYVDVKKIMSEYFDVPLVITNDANAAALGEMKFGAAKNMKDFIVITLGTGLGSGIVSGGQLIYGHDGMAGEIGHTIVFYGGRECGCGRKGCLETYVSATGICRTALEFLSNYQDASELRKFTKETLTSKDIFTAAKKGDSIALRAFDFTCRILGFKLADSVAHTSPEAIFLTGGLANAGELIFDSTKRYMEENLLFSYKNKVKLLPSGLDNNYAAILGAAALVTSL
ncbi:MAG: ROK family protein [Bacteroidota bacterium]|nr:ROK family protein [Bacteroidota bacterium]